MASRGRSWGDLALTYLSGPFAAFILFYSVVDLPEAWAAGRDRGLPGTFTAVRQDCDPTRFGGESCTWHGTYESRDGTVSLDDVSIDGGVDRVGQEIPAQYFEESRLRDTKVYELGSTDWIFVAVMLVGSAAWLIGWVHLVIVKPYRDGRRAKHRR